MKTFGHNIQGPFNLLYDLTVHLLDSKNMSFTMQTAMFTSGDIDVDKFPC